MIILACSSGGSSPTDSGDDNGNGDNTNPYELPNAVDYGCLLYTSPSPRDDT